MKKFLPAFILAIIIYLFTSFICGSLNFMEWDVWARILSVIVFIVSVSDIIENDNSKTKN